MNSLYNIARFRILVYEDLNRGSVLVKERLVMIIPSTVT